MWTWPCIPLVKVDKIATLLIKFYKMIILVEPGATLLLVGSGTGLLSNSLYIIWLQYVDQSRYVDVVVLLVDSNVVVDQR